MSQHKVDDNFQMGELVDELVQPTKDINPYPVEERPIELVYNNLQPYAFAEVRIFGRTLNPATYSIDAEKGLITLSYHFIRVNVSTSNEEPSE